jgi:hypothetical protein
MTVVPDRLELLRTQTALTGVDFVYVHDSQVQIDVFLHVEPDDLDVPLVGDLDRSDVHITSAFARERSPIPVEAVSWPVVEGRRVLRLTVAEPGEFVIYRLRVADDRFDDHFNDVPFSFQAGCPSRLDCAPRHPACPNDLPDGPPTDLTARDFWSMRRAMLDAATLLEPRWADRSQADQLVMLVEALASVGDELSYTQDRVRWEASLEHATQLRSLRRHARLVDHRMHDGRGASTWLAVTAGGPVGIGTIAAGTAVWAESDEGARVPFSIGTGLQAELDGDTYVVDHRRNALRPHLADLDATCLPKGATSVVVAGHVGAAFPDPGDPPLMVALHERSDDAGVEPRTWFIPVTSGVDDDDPLVADPDTAVVPAPVTVLTWDESSAPPFDFDLTATTVYANVVPATAGSTHSSEFVVGPAGALALPEAIERCGPGSTVAFLHSIPDPDGRGVVWRPAAGTHIAGGGSLRATVPEVAVLERRDPDPAVRWEWRPALVGPGASTPVDRHVTLDDGTWGPAVTYHRADETIMHHDWLGGGGYTVRFGDGEFGAPPPVGAHFEVVYRLGNGPAGNVPARSIRHHDPTVILVDRVTNLQAVTDGTDPESIEEMRRVAPYEWQTIAYRAVRAEDYAEALTRRPWVQAAGASSTWTGSWLSVIATPDPLDGVVMTEPWRTDGEAQLDRFRQAGRDAWLAEPRYADLDIDVVVCVEASTYPGLVIERVLKALVGDPSRPRRDFFFDPNHFVFGTPLNRAALDAAIQAVPGVKAVEDLAVRRRGHHDWKPMPAIVWVGVDELVRVVNDTAHPERGTVRITTRGGA